MYWSIGREKLMRWWYAFSTSPGVVRTSPGLVLPTQGLVRTSRRVVKRTLRNVGPDKRGGSVTLNMPPSVLNLPFTCAHIRNFFPEKAFTSFTQSVFPSDFQRFLVWRVGVQSIHTGGECSWCAEGANLHTGNRLNIRKQAIEIWTRAVNIWKDNASYAFPLEICRKHSLLEGLNDFFEDKNAYRGTWTGGQ